MDFKRTKAPTFPPDPHRCSNSPGTSRQVPPPAFPKSTSPRLSKASSHQRRGGLGRETGGPDEQDSSRTAPVTEGPPFTPAGVRSLPPTTLCLPSLAAPSDFILCLFHSKGIFGWPDGNYKQVKLSEMSLGEMVTLPLPSCSDAATFSGWAQRGPLGPRICRSASCRSSKARSSGAGNSYP